MPKAIVASMFKASERANGRSVIIGIYNSKLWDKCEKEWKLLTKMFDLWN